MIVTKTKKVFTTSDGKEWPTLAEAQSAQLMLLLLRVRVTKATNPDDAQAEEATMYSVATAIAANSPEVVSILTNRKPRKDRGKSRKKSVYQTTQEILDKAAADGIARANEKAKAKAPTGGITFGRGGVTKEQS